MRSARPPIDNTDKEQLCIVVHRAYDTINQRFFTSAHHSPLDDSRSQNCKNSSTP